LNVDFWTGFAASLALIVAIGSQNAFVLRQGILRQHVAPLVLFCSLSDAALILLGIGGAGALIHDNPWLVETSLYAGAAFLLAYAFFAARRALHPSRLLPTDAPGLSLKGALVACFGFIFFNPHVYLDTVVLLGTLANQHQQAGRSWFGASAALASMSWFSALGFGTRWFQPWFKTVRACRLLDGLIALTMLGLAWMLV
jgi:L-lysine exporter family protein LysE/ArgO